MIRGSFIELLEVSIEHLQQIWHANIGRLHLRTTGPSHIWDLHFVLLGETNLFPELVVIFSGLYTSKTPGTFSIFLSINCTVV